MGTVLVRGTGDVGSAVAYALYRAGHSVVLHDTPRPPHHRRGMAFVDALFGRVVNLEGVLGKRARTLDDLPHMVRCGRAVPVCDAPFEEVIATVRPDVLVDARMRKRVRPESQRGLAPLTIGLGPNFEAGANTDAVVETAWGDELGAVLWSGRTRDLAGEPQEIAGHTRTRYVYASCAGVFSTRFAVGDSVAQGQEIARIDGTPLHAPLSGCLRGLTHDGARVEAGTKVIEVDPRGIPQAVHGLGERPRRIAEGVLKAINVKSRNALPSANTGRAFTVGGLIGALGGLIGLGGAEFRLPALVGLFGFHVREAIVMNVVLSLVTVTASLIFRAGMHGTPPFLEHLDAVIALAFGALVGAFAGASLVSRLRTHLLHRTLAVLLGGLAIVMAAHGFLPQGGGPLTENAMALFALGSLLGTGIGIVGSMLGVAGGELLIPTLVLLYGVDILTAGTLALSVSLPMLLVTLWRMKDFPSARAVVQQPKFLLAMAAGSFLGAFVGSQLAGIAPEHVLGLTLAAILATSAIKTFAR
jgi:xanthine dehydrogenase accessory factor